MQPQRRESQQLRQLFVVDTSAADHAPTIFFTRNSSQQYVQVIIVGGGLAALSAAHTLLERGAGVLLLDKQPSVSRHVCIPGLLTISVFASFMGGNSTKATSGINGAGTQTQQEQGIPDNAKIFFEDTKRSVRSHSNVALGTYLPDTILHAFIGTRVG